MGGVDIIHPYYCNLEKEECICRYYIKDGWCEQIERMCPHQKLNIFGMDIMIDELQTSCEIDLAILKAMNKEE